MSDRSAFKSWYGPDNRNRLIGRLFRLFIFFFIPSIGTRSTWKGGFITQTGVLRSASRVIGSLVGIITLEATSWLCFSDPPSLRKGSL